MCTVSIVCVYCVCTVSVCLHIYHRSLHTAGDFTGVQTFLVRKHGGSVVASRTEALGEDTLGVVEAGSVYYNLQKKNKNRHQ